VFELRWETVNVLSSWFSQVTHISASFIPSPTPNPAHLHGKRVHALYNNSVCVWRKETENRRNKRLKKGQKMSAHPHFRRKVMFRVTFVESNLKLKQIIGVRPALHFVNGSLAV
jgi:hypothetical protein